MTAVLHIDFRQGALKNLKQAARDAALPLKPIISLDNCCFYTLKLYTHAHNLLCYRLHKDPQDGRKDNQGLANIHRHTHSVPQSGTGNNYQKHDRFGLD